MQRTIKISYYWKPASDSTAPIKPEHVHVLNDSATARLQEMMAQGYTEGELSDSIKTSAEDGPNGIAYRGWWESETIDPRTEHTGIVTRSIGPFYYGGWDTATDQPIWEKDPAGALKIPVSQLGETVNKIAPHTRGSVNGIVNPT